VAIACGDGLIPRRRLVLIPGRRLVFDRRRSRESVALVVRDEFVVGKPLLMEVGLLMADLGLLALALGLLRGDPGALLGRLGPLLAHRGLLAVLGHGPLAPAVHLGLASAKPCVCHQARQREQQRHDSDYDYDDHDDQCS
jgi:hypothetical protein